MANGIGVRISTMARRSGLSLPIEECQDSIRLRKAGRYCRESADPARARLAMEMRGSAAGAARRAIDSALRSCPLTNRKATARLHQRLPAGDPGKRRSIHSRGNLDGQWRLRSWATPNARGNYFPCSIPSGTRSTLQNVDLYMAVTSVKRVVRRRYLRRVPPHTGRGGWTWYTGSAGWMYRLIVETLLGLRLEVDKLRVNPRLAARAGDSFKMHYRYRETFYQHRW